MDSKQRHELGKNELAKWIITQYEDWIRPNSSWLGYAVLGVLIVVAIILGITRVNNWNRAVAWKQYYAALHSESDLEIIADSTSSIVSVYARLALAQRQLTEGCTLAFTDKTQSVLTLEKALASFEQVQKKTNNPSLLQEAGYGLGQCWEGLAAARVGSDDLRKSEEEYQNIVQRWGNSFMGKRAKKQLALIRQSSTQEFIKVVATKTIEPPSAGASDFPWDGSSNFDDPVSPGPIDFGALEKTTEEPKTEEFEQVSE